MTVGRLALLVILMTILGVPFLLRPSVERELSGKDTPTIVVVTPHVPQIRREFGEAFDAWHLRRFGTQARVDWRVPGGTSEIMKQLEAQYQAAVKNGDVDFAEPRNPAIKPGVLTVDAMFGGGSFDHGRLKSLEVLPLALEATLAGTAGTTEITAQLGMLSLPEHKGRSIKRGTIKLRWRTASGEIFAANSANPGAFAKDPRSSGAETILESKVNEKTGELQLKLSGPPAEDIRVTVQTVRVLPMSQPRSFPKEKLDEWYGENKIGSGFLYDPDQYWLGTALSGFGIIYNKDEFDALQMPYPASFDDLAKPELFGRVALADPRQSGSVTTAFEGILNFYGWERGWGLLREVSGNARFFTNSSPKTPLDVSQGEAAAGLTIDFYGRGQSQAVIEPGGDAGSSRVGYVDPRGTTYIDADPISILRGGPNPELASRFVEFLLTEEAQALWQFRSVDTPEGMSNPPGENGEPMGPRFTELRRMPARRVMYEKYMLSLIDQVNPFEIASTVKPAGWRSAIGLMMGAFAIDIAHEQREAWGALCRSRSDTAFPQEARVEMERLYYAWPTTLVDGKELAFTAETFRAVTASWKAPGAVQRAEVAYTAFFRENYRRIVEIEAGIRTKTR